ncbi:DUF2846 domain-containing protein [Saccharophagus degradans]|uniref:DUF2846 domain-containing protein n=1 Tax=Saccharophagus degradans (strain 2-40 / ATCC 43961 / DSM 17024) TaxID=203122 RepID=Q21F39_SACD2|nr:DUF2846 domain-containing protein [Saccharophagus degradans]ABD82690.1 conserved hypothetical protein [Saccharophagus degradans 2-40]
MKYFILVMVYLVVSGCASLGQKFSEPMAVEQDKALVYFYRPARFFQGGGGPDVYVNEVKEFRMHNGGYAFRYFNPGEYTISTRKHFNWGLEGVDKAVSLNAGEVYYFRMDFSDSGVNVISVGGFATGEVSGVVAFNLIENSVATTEIKETSLIQ